MDVLEELVQTHPTENKVNQLRLVKILRVTLENTVVSTSVV